MLLNNLVSLVLYIRPEQPELNHVTDVQQLPFAEIKWGRLSALTMGVVSRPSKKVCFSRGWILPHSPEPYLWRPERRLIERFLLCLRQKKLWSCYKQECDWNVRTRSRLSSSTCKTFLIQIGFGFFRSTVPALQHARVLSSMNQWPWPEAVKHLLFHLQLKIAGREKSAAGWGWAHRLSLPAVGASVRRDLQSEDVRRRSEIPMFENHLDVSSHCRRASLLQVEMTVEVTCDA